MRTGNNSAEGIYELAMDSGMPQSVTGIEGLEAFSEAIRNGSTGMEYRADTDMHQPLKPDHAALKERKKKCENYLARLQSLYIYGESGISEKDYLIERKKLISEIEQIESSMNEQHEEQGFEADFVEKASYFIMVDKLVNGKTVSIKGLDPSVPKAFLNRVIDRITIMDDRVYEIRFKSQLSIRFIYATKKPQL